jgi:hypothetical protein
MKRFHVHVSVEDIQQSVRFYSTLFAAQPTVLKPDYAKWMLDDPRVNFAISRRGGEAGIEHLGIQVENETELNEVYERLSRAERPVLEEKGTTCCYARSDKQWIADPQGVEWETFLTHGEATIYGHSRGAVKPAEVQQGANEVACSTPSAADRVSANAAPRARASSCGCGSTAAAE